MQRAIDRPCTVATARKARAPASVAVTIELRASLGSGALVTSPPGDHAVDQARDAGLANEHVGRDVAQAGAHRGGAHGGEQHVVLGLRDVGSFEIAHHQGEQLVLGAEEALPRFHGELAVSHGYQRTHRPVRGAGRFRSQAWVAELVEALGR